MDNKETITEVEKMAAEAAFYAINPSKSEESYDIEEEAWLNKSYLGSGYLSEDMK